MIEPWPPQTKITNPDGTATFEFLNWSQRLADDLKDKDTKAAALAVQQATAQTVANAAAETAAAAYEDTTGATTQERSADSVVTALVASWVEGPTVNFAAAVAVAHVTASDSGPQYYGDYKVPTMTGLVRLVQIIGASETVLETVAFSADNETGQLTFAGFTYNAASAATGSVSYRVDAMTDGGFLSGLGLRTHIVRAP